MPGVYVTTALRTGPSNPVGPPSARFFVAGIAERGPIDRAVRVQSVAQYVATFGARTSFSGILYDQVSTFFEEGGSDAYVARVTGPAAIAAHLALKDRSTSPGANTLDVAAKNGPGAWANTELSVEIVDGTVSGFTVNVYVNAVKVESFPNLSSPASAVTASYSSKYIVITDSGSVTAAPANNPAVLARTPLAAGVDDRAAVNATLLTAALVRFGKGLGPGIVAIPGQTGDVIAAALGAHCAANRRMGILTGSRTADLTAMTAIRTIGASTGFGDYLIPVGPWVTIPDGVGSRDIDPSGYVAGVRARAQAAVGFWQNPAGSRAAARYVIGTVGVLDQTLNDNWAAVGVTGIQTYNDQVRLFGWSTCSDDSAYRSAKSRDMLNVLSGAIEQALDPFVFANIDGRGQLLSQIEGACKGVLQPIADANGFFPMVADDGTEQDPGYAVQIDAEANNAVSLGSNKILANVAVRPGPDAEVIQVSVVRTALDSNL